MNLIDRTPQTAEIFQTLDGRNIFSRGRRDARRSVGSISGVILHQTAFFTDRISRMDTVIANYAVMTNGTVLKLRDPEMMLNSIGTNKRAIDIEFVGNYPNERQIRRSGGRGLRVPSWSQVLAGRELLKHLRARHGVKRIWGHVQFTPKNCPGPHLWYNVGEWAIAHLGLSATGAPPMRPGWREESLAIGRPGALHVGGGTYATPPS